MHFSWETVVIGVISAAIEYFLKPVQTVIKPLFEKAMQDRFRKNQKGVYERKIAITSLLNLIEDQEGVVKAVQIQTKNGGGIPKANTPIYGSIVSPAKYSDTFKSQLLDSQYCDLVSKLISQKMITFTTDDLPNCLLKDLLMAQGVKSTSCYDACISKSDYNFIAIDFSVLPQQLTPETKDNIRQHVNELIKILNK